MNNYFPDPSGFAAYTRSRPEYQDKIKAFAERLHTQFCSLGHEDNCTWFFERHWTCWSHKKWFDKAEDLLSSGAPEELIVDIINSFKGRK